MIKKLQKKYALSEQGAKDLIKGCLACVLQNLSFMFPVGLLYYLVSDLMNGGVPGGKIPFYVAGCVVCIGLILLTTFFQYNATYFATYKESGIRRITLAEHLRKIPLSFFGKKDLADLTSTIMADCTFLEQSFSHFIPELAGSIISTILISIDRFMDTVDEDYLAQFGYTKDQVLAENDVVFSNLKDLGKVHTEHNLGDIIADAYVYAVENAADYDGVPVDLAVVPSGTVRDTYARGDITVEQVFNSFSLGIGADGVPGYPLIEVYLTGKELRTAAEIDASVSDFMTTARLYCSGLNFTYNPHRLLLNKVTDVYLVKDGQRVELQDDKLYRVVADLYSGQMLNAVTDMSYGILSIVPKYADGTPIEDFEDVILTENGKELKGWDAIARYMASFEDTDGDGIGNVPDYYSTLHDRKKVEDSRSLSALLKKPNRFAFILLGVILTAVLLVVCLVLLLRKLVRKLRRRKKAR